MKLIIECTELTYSECKKISGLSETAYVIAHGIPYNPSGDLISRSALLKEFGYTDEWYKGRSICNIIDNAQAIPLPNEQIISDIPKDYLYDTETAEFYVYRNKYTGKEIHIVKNPPAYILDKRPKGEWVYNEKLNMYFCKDCGLLEPLTKEEIEEGCKLPNFCQQCGADMRKGGAE